MHERSSAMQTDFTFHAQAAQHRIVYLLHAMCNTCQCRIQRVTPCNALETLTAELLQSLNPHARRHIGNHAEQTDLLACRRNQSASIEVSPELGLVTTPILAVQVHIRNMTSQQGQHIGSSGIALLRVHQAHVLGTHQTLHRHTEHLCHAFIGLRNDSPPVHHEDGHTGRIEHLLQHAFALSQGLQQAVHSADELADFILTRDGQTHGRMVRRCQCIQILNRRPQGRQLQAQHRAREYQRHDSQHTGRPEQPPLHMRNRGKRFCGWQDGGQIPPCRIDAVRRSEHFDAVWRNKHFGAAETRDEAIHDRICAGWGKPLQRPRPVGRRYDAADLRRNQQIPTRTTVNVARDGVQKIFRAQVGDANHGRHDVPLRIAQRHGNAKLRQIAAPINSGQSNIGLPQVQRCGHTVHVQ